jgi:hypothetical protein
MTRKLNFPKDLPTYIRSGYQNIPDGKGFLIADARASVELAYKIRHMHSRRG